MPIFFSRNNISTLDVGAVVNLGKVTPVVGDEIEKEIYGVAGYDQLFKAREELGIIVQGEAKYTEGFGSKADYIIHAAAGKVAGTSAAEQTVFRKAIRNSIMLATELKVESLAIPFFIDKGTVLSDDLTCSLLLEDIQNAVKDRDISVFLATYEFRDTDTVFEELKNDVLLEELDYDIISYQDKLKENPKLKIHEEANCCYSNYNIASSNAINTSIITDAFRFAGSLEEIIKHKRTDFSDAVMDIMRKKDLSNADVYRRANMDRRYFSKIINRQVKNPSKNNILAIIIGLQLNCDESVELLSLAGFGYNPSDVTDIIVFYNIEKGNYDILKINMDLYEYGKESLGYNK